METKTIKVEVPEGCTAKYDAATQTIKFIPEDYTIIKDFETACKVLGITSAIPDEIQDDRQICAIYKMKIVLRAVNKDHTFNLIDGQVWYPYARFIEGDDEMNYFESKVLDFNYEGKTFTLLGGSIGSTYGGRGLGVFNSIKFLGYSSADIGLFACYTEEIAHHVSKYFATLIFDCCFAGELGFSLSNGEMVTKNYHINE